MAVIDPLTGAVVIRVIYDGAPFAGKTTSVRALAGGLGGQVRSPGEIEGRTLFFDWLDYTGGLFEGRRIRCQIVSVPGQAVLAPRRRRLLDTADVVVYVSDSSPEAFASERGYLEGLKHALRGRKPPPVGIVVQANKRDLPTAVPLSQIRELLDTIGLRAAIVESDASSNSGVRETFVLAVRLALDRVRELLSTGMLLEQRAEIDNEEELLADLTRNDTSLASLANEMRLPHTRLRDIASGEVRPSMSATPVITSTKPSPGLASKPESIAAQALMQALAENELPRPAVANTDDSAAEAGNESATDAIRQPMLPDERVASGLIWPVVLGRTILSELTHQPAELSLDSEGSWTGNCNGRWRLCSPANTTFTDLEKGRQALVDWARLHVILSPVLSADRCIVLNADHHGRTRLWQVFRTARTLDQELAKAYLASTREYGIRLLASVLALQEVQAKLDAAAAGIPASLDCIALDDLRATFVGRMPLGRQHGLQNTSAAVPPMATSTLRDQLSAEIPELRLRRAALRKAFADAPALWQAPADRRGNDSSSFASYARQAKSADIERAGGAGTAVLAAV